MNHVNPPPDWQSEEVSHASMRTTATQMYYAWSSDSRKKASQTPVDQWDQITLGRALGADHLLDLKVKGTINMIPGGRPVHILFAPVHTLFDPVHSLGHFGDPV